MTRRDATGWLLVGVVVCIVGALALRKGPERPEIDEETPAAPAPAIDLRGRYVGSEACARCHEDEHASWHGSYHRTMTQRASPQTVMGRFSVGSLDEGGLYRVETEGDAFFVTEPGRGRRRVTLVTGSHHMQVYWPEADAGGRLEAFAWAYLLDEERWVPNDATLLRPPGAKVTYTWNRVCIKCHAVAGVPGYDEASDVATTRVAELGIACEACHGPGKAHVETEPEPVAGDGTIVHPEGIEPKLASQACGQCHSITVFNDDDAWVKAGHEGAPPDPISAWGSLVQHPLMASSDQADALLDEDPDFFADRFWSDGMVRVSGREYNGLVESPCAADPKFSCLTCHQMHADEAGDGGPWNDDQLRAGVRDGTVCVGCHAGLDAKTHTHHEPGEGSNCLDCHMPRTTYGLLKAIRSHRIDSPDLEATEVTGRPHACNLCHQDRSLSWTARWLATWWGAGEAEAGAAPAVEAPPAAVQWLLAGDAGQRALLAWHLAWPPAVAVSGTGWQRGLLERLLDDPYAAIRLIAERSIAQLPAVSPAPLVDEATVAALKARRNDRPVSLAE